MKKLPELKTDKEAEDFVDTADLSEYDLSQAVPVEMRFKDEQFNTRMPKDLLTAAKGRAAALNMPMSRYIRQLVERDLQDGL